MSKLAPTTPGGQIRRPSGGRPAPPSIPSYLGSSGPQPVRAEYFRGAGAQPFVTAATTTSQHQVRSQEKQLPRPFKPQLEHRPSMPSPKSTFIQPHSSPYAQHHAQRNGTLGSSTSSRPSPNLSSASEDSLRETTRHNILQAAHGVDPRGNLASARQASANLNWDVKSPRSPMIATPEESYSGSMKERDEVDIHFENLLDSLQVPNAVRQKFSTVSPSVKSSILSSTASSNPAILSHLGLPLPTAHSTPKIKKKLSAPLLRKAKSSGSIGSSPGSSPQVGKTYRVDGDSFTIVASPNQMMSPNVPSPLSPASTSGPVRGQSMDIARPTIPAFNRLSAGPSGSNGTGRPLSFSMFAPNSLSRSTNGTASSGGSRGTGLGINLGEQPEPFISWLSANKATDLSMDVARMKKLRMLLRHEATTWVEHFLRLGGYKLLLERLAELVDVEWREEQHDDQMLHEVLRCVKALGTSEVGKTALRIHFPDPFPSLSKLLFSEKKPGDLASRQLIIELWAFLFDLFPASPPATSPPTTSSSSTTRPTSIRFDTSLMAGSGPSRRPINAADEVRELLIPDIPDKSAEQHDFVRAAHRPRVFRCWMAELSDICRDYFWIMCHGSNTLWAADEVDELLVEKPVAPGGATGGVEFEAMNYVTTHFKLLNTLCKHMMEQNREKAAELHRDLLQSGMDRILVTMRKASTTFYPALHLEIARYVRHLQLVSPNARLPHLIDKLVGPPPEAYRRPPRSRPISTNVPSVSSFKNMSGARAGAQQQQPQQRGREGSTQAQTWLEEARQGGRVGDGGRRGGYDLQV